MTGKNILMLFAPKFERFGCDVARSFIARCGGGRVHGLCTGSTDVRKHVAKTLRDIGGRFWHLPDEEKIWLSTPVTDAGLSRLDRDLGPGGFGRIVTADRRIGRGFVRGGLTRPDEFDRIITRGSPAFVQRYVHGLYRFLDEAIRETSTDVVFCYAVAGAPAVALAELCESRQIPFCRLTPTRIGDQYTIDIDPRGRQISLQRRYECARDGRNPFPPSAIRNAHQQLEAFRTSPVQPGYAARPKRSRLLRNIVKFPLHVAKELSHGRWPGLHAARLWFNVRITCRRIFDEHAWFRTARDLPPSFIYFPLHVDPEASTMVLSPWQTDQLAAIEALAKAAPAHMHVVVKEHFPMLGRRPNGYYRQIARMPRVRLLGPHQSPFPIIRRAALIVVITGTAAWEALLMRKPALVLGDSPFRAIREGLVYEPNLSRLPTAIRDAISLEPASDEALSLYLAASTSESIDMPSSLIWGQYERHPIGLRLDIAKRIADHIFSCATRC